MKRHLHYREEEKENIQHHTITTGPNFKKFTLVHEGEVYVVQNIPPLNGVPVLGGEGRTHSNKSSRLVNKSSMLLSTHLNSSEKSWFSSQMFSYSQHFANT